MIPYDVLMAAARGRQALRRGDLLAAERWFKLADRAASIAKRLCDVAHADMRADERRSVYRNPP